MKTMCMDDVLKITSKNCTGNLWAHVKSESRERFEYITRNLYGYIGHPQVL